MRGLPNRLWRRHSKKTVLIAAVIILGLCLLGGGAYAALGGTLRQSDSGDIDLQRGLVGHWRMDGSAKDSTPNANNGTLTSATPINDRNGKAGGALNLTSGYMTLPASPVLNNSVFTYSLWVYRSGGQPGPFIASSALDGPAFRYWEDNTIGLRKQGGTNFSPSTQEMPLNEWVHVMGTYDASGTNNLYINGQPAGSSTLVMTFTFSNFVIGRTTDNIINQYDGYMDDLKMYNRVLTAAEAKALYDSYDTATRLGGGQDGLVGHWKLDGNLKDSTPYANKGSGVPAWTADRKGQANLAANSFESQISVTNLPDLNGPLSQSAWVYNTGDGLVTSIRSATDSIRFGLQVSGKIYVRVGADYNAASTTVPLNTWSHIAYTFDGSIRKIYLNGSLVDTGTTSLSPFVPTMVVLGSAGGSLGFPGKLDDIRIYKRALSDADIAAIYNSYDSQINLNSSPANTASSGNINTGLVAHWPFNGNAKDSTPYANNGTVSGATPSTDRLGRANSAYSFNGTSSKVLIPNSAILQLNGDMTLVGWVKVASNTNYNTILSKSSTGEYEVAADLRVGNNNSAAWRSTNSGTTTNVPDYFTSYIGSWVHVVVSVTAAGSTTTYRNGITASTGTVGTRSVTSSPVAIGARPDNTFFFGGDIDDVRIYNRVLTISEVQTLYNSQN